MDRICSQACGAISRCTGLELHI